MAYTMYFTQAHPIRYLRGKITGTLGGTSNNPGDYFDTLADYTNAEIADVDFRYQFHDGTTFQDKTAITAEFSATEFEKDEIAVLSPLPIPCMLEINGTEIEVDDGSLELELSNYGKYYIRSLETSKLEKTWVIYAI